MLKNDCAFTIGGTEYNFEVWQRDQNRVLVAFYAKNGETFGIWTAGVDSLPVTQQDAEEVINNRDWAVEEMTTLCEEGFKPVQ